MANKIVTFSVVDTVESTIHLKRNKLLQTVTLAKVISAI